MPLSDLRGGMNSELGAVATMSDDEVDVSLYIYVVIDSTLFENAICTSASFC